MYLASLAGFQESTGAWQVLYKEQGNDKTFGTWRCEREIQSIHLQLNSHRRAEATSMTRQAVQMTLACGE